MKKRTDVYIQAVKPYAMDKDIKQLIIMQSVLLNMGFRVVIKKETRRGQVIKSDVSVIYGGGDGWVCNECNKKVDYCKKCGEPFIDSEVIFCPEHICEKCGGGEDEAN